MLPSFTSCNDVHKDFSEVSIILLRCSKDSNPVKEEPPSYIDSYKVNLLDTVGTIYEGDYFPLNEGDDNQYTGEQISTTSIYLYPQPVVDTADIFRRFRVLAKRAIQLPSGVDSLYPIEDFTISGIDTSRFFKKDTAAVYMKAYKMQDGSFYEMVNPLFIKRKLVVGDSWETAPQIDMTKMMAQKTSSFEIQSSRPMLELNSLL